MELSDAFEMLIAAAMQGDVVKTNQWVMYIRAHYTLDAAAAFVAATFGRHHLRAMEILNGRHVALAPTTTWRKA